MAHKMLGWGLCILSGVLLTGCERPNVSVSELGRIDYALPDTPELTQKYQLKDFPEEIDIYDHEIKNQDFLKQLQAHGIISTNSVTNGTTSEAATPEAVPSKMATAAADTKSAVKTEATVVSDVTGTNAEPTTENNVPVSDNDLSASITPTAPAGDAPPPTDSSRVDSSEPTSDESTPPSQGFEILEETESGDDGANVPDESGGTNTPATPPVEETVTEAATAV